MVISEPLAALSGASILASALSAQAIFLLKRNIKKAPANVKMNFLLFIPLPPYLRHGPAKI
jgi:hypothetical protein